LNPVNFNWAILDPNNHLDAQQRQEFEAQEVEGILARFAAVVNEPNIFEP